MKKLIMVMTLLMIVRSGVSAKEWTTPEALRAFGEPGDTVKESATPYESEQPQKTRKSSRKRINKVDEAVAAPEAQATLEKSERRQPHGKKERRNKPVARAEEPPVTSERPFFGVQMPDDSIPCPAALQAALTARLVKYNQAAVAGNFNDFEQHIIEYQATESRKALAGLSKKELQERRKLLQSLGSRNYRATACLVTRGGVTAALAGRGSHEGNDNAHGSFLFRKEGDVWKVQSSVWNMSM